PHGPEWGDHPQRLDDLGDVHDLLPRRVAGDPPRGLRGGRHRRRRRVGHLPADHVPAPSTRPLLRGHGRRHRRAPALRPGCPDRQRRRGAGELPDDARPVPVQRRLQTRAIRVCGGHRRGAVPDHLHGDVDPAPDLRGPRTGDRMSEQLPQPTMVPVGRATVVVTSAPPPSTAAVAVGDSSHAWRRRIAYVFLIGYALLMFVPFGWTVITSFKTLEDSVRFTLIPNPFTTAAWDYAINNLQPNIIQMFFNSFTVATAVTLTNVVLGSLAGYAFARLRFPGRNILFLIVLATLMIPDQLRMLPIYIITNAIGLGKGP